MDLSHEHKIKVEQRIMETVINSLEKGELTQEQYDQIGDFVLGRIDSINTHHDLIIFLRELTEKWAIFSFVLTIESGEVKNIEGKKAAEKAEDLIQNGEIENAVRAIKNALSDTRAQQ